MNIISRLNKIQEKLSDPIVLDWALRRIEERRIFNPLVADEIEKTLFPTPVVRGLIDKDDPEVLASLFSTLSPDRFADVVDIMIERWPQWEPRVAATCAEHIAWIAPEKAEDLFRGYFASSESFSDEKKIGVANALLAIAPQRGRELALTLIDMNLPADEYLVEDYYLFTSIFALARAHGLPVLSSLIETLLTSQLPNVKSDDLLESVYKELTDDVFLYWHASNLTAKYTDQTFSSLGFLFRENAPLKELDDLLTGKIHKHLTKAAAFLEKYCSSEEAAAVVLAAYRSCKGEIKKENRKQVVRFMAAIGAACVARVSTEISELTIEQLLKQMNVDMQVKPFKEYVRRIQSFPREDVVRLVQESAQSSRGVFPRINLMALMAELGFPEFVPLLADLLGSENRAVHEAAFFSLCQFGAVVEGHIIAKLPEMNPSQKMAAIDVLSKTGGEASVRALLDAYRDLRRESLDKWCLAALELPDARFIKVLEPELRRKQHWIDKAFVSLCLLHDQNHPQLLEVRKRIETRQRQDRALQNGDNRKISLAWELECPLCGDRNDYEIKRVLVNPYRESDPPYFPEEITCLSCGSVAEMELTPHAQSNLQMQVAFSLLQLKLNMEPQGPVKLVTSLDTLPLKEMLQKYREALAMNPDSVPDMLGLANCSDNLDKVDEAENLYRRCWELDKTCVEAASKIADILLRRENKQTAFEILHEAMRRRPHWNFYKSPDRKKTASDIMNLYDSLKEELFPEEEEASLPSSVVKKNRDVGRNAPCPCGSGKKYKKCCLSKDF